MDERERREAIDAGERALQSLNQARDSLRSARNWGVWDILGGGLISTIAKHRRMDDARCAMEQARRDLQVFTRELGDVNLTIDIGDLMTFADYFFDGFFADMMVQGSIVDAQNQVEDITARVEALLAYLYNQV